MLPLNNVFISDTSTDETNKKFKLSDFTSDKPVILGDIRRSIFLNNIQNKSVMTKIILINPVAQMPSAHLPRIHFDSLIYRREFPSGQNQGALLLFRTSGIFFRKR